MQSRLVDMLLLLMLWAMAALPSLAQPAGAYLIKGEIHDIRGRPMPGAYACAQAGSKGLLCARADAYGKFVILVMDSGRYIVNPRGVLTRPPGTFAARDEYPVSAGQEVSLDDSRREAFVSLTVPPRNGLIILKIVDSQTQLPIDLISVQIGQDNKPGVGLFFRSDEGEYEIYVPEEPVYVAIAAPNYKGRILLDDKTTIIKPESTVNLAIEMERRSEAANMASSDREKDTRTHLPAPVPLAPAENESFSHYPRTTILKWSEVRGAESYRVEVDYCQNSGTAGKCFKPAPMVNPFFNMKPIDATTYTFDFIGSQPGRWRVWAVDKEGREGLKSRWRMFTYSR